MRPFIDSESLLYSLLYVNTCWQKECLTQSLAVWDFQINGVLISSVTSDESGGAVQKSILYFINVFHKDHRHNSQSQSAREETVQWVPMSQELKWDESLTTSWSFIVLDEIEKDK